MLNQSSMDNLYYVNYVENYLDCVENLPDDVQRYLSRMHELDISYRGFLKDVEMYKEILEKEEVENSTQRKILCKLEQVLISLQEVGDEKVEIGQQIIDLIDNKYRQLDQDRRNIDFCKDQENTDPSQKETPGNREGHSAPNNGSGTTGSNGGGSGGGGGSNGGGGERGNKRPRRNRAETETEVEPRPARKTSSGGKKKKRKVREWEGGANEGGAAPREDELQHDADEPTYCLCDQISYGEMILCDNDLCPIEWFHFVCVALTSKPKGKWFCPKCRGDRPNVMKPKSQFLKELERYNKEKEEKS